MSDRNVINRLKELFEIKTGIKINRTLRKLYIFRDEDVIVPLSREYGVVLWDLESVKRHYEIVKRHYKEAGLEGYTAEGRAEAKFLISKEYMDYVVEIRGKEYVPWYFVRLNYNRGRLEGFLGIFYKKITSIYGWRYRYY